MSDPKWLEEDKRRTTICAKQAGYRPWQISIEGAEAALKRAHAHIAELRELIKADLYVRAHMVLDRDTPPETP